MKKIILSALALGFSALFTSVNAQFYVVENGAVVYSSKTMPDYITFELPCGGEIGEAVDLGLSVKWASWNVGASAPEEIGNYYAWGETEIKETYSWQQYSFMAEGYSDWIGVNKYTYEDNQTEGVWYQDGVFVGDGKNELDDADDVAVKAWGSNWKMPTIAQQDELINECYWVWTDTYNGKAANGYIIFKAKSNEDKGVKIFSDGTPSVNYNVATDAHIFLPAGGNYSSSGLNYVDSRGYYWTRSLRTDDSHYAHDLRFQSAEVSWGSGISRFMGLTVRAVSTK